MEKFAWALFVGGLVFFGLPWEFWRNVTTEDRVVLILTWLIILAAAADIAMKNGPSPPPE